MIGFKLSWQFQYIAYSSLSDSTYSVNFCCPLVINFEHKEDFFLIPAMELYRGNVREAGGCGRGQGIARFSYSGIKNAQQDEKS